MTTVGLPDGYYLEMSQFQNVGCLHSVKCEWCGLKMACNCWDGNQPDRAGHIMILCPRCQVTDLLNLIFGHEALRDVLLSKVEKFKTACHR